MEVIGGTGGVNTEYKMKKASADMTNWGKVVALVTADFGEGMMVEDYPWKAVVLTPKEKGDYHGIRFVEVMWKLVVEILNCMLSSSIIFHDFLHGFWVGRGTGTATLKAKMLQKLESLREEVLYVIFLDLYKMYYALDRDRCLEILEGYGMGPQACRLLRKNWSQLRMVTKAGDTTDRLFKGSGGWLRGT